MWPAIALASVILAGAPPSQDGLLLTGLEAETFLREDIGIGVTKPQKLTLSDGTTTCAAAWKTVDIFRRGLTRVTGGQVERDFRDSYKFEIAAYELDKLLGLGFVPPTVELKIRGETGSLQLWVHGTITEWDRQQENIPITSPKAYVEGMLTLRLFHQLTHNIDYKNVRNVLIGDGQVWATSLTLMSKPRGSRSIETSRRIGISTSSRRSSLIWTKSSSSGVSRT